MSIFLKQIFRHFLATISRTPFRFLGAISFLSVLFFLVFLLSILGISTNKSISFAEYKVDLVFFLEKDTVEHKVKTLLTRLQTLKNQGRIESFRFFSKEEAEKIFQEQYPEKYSFITRNKLENPFRDSFEIIPKKIGIEGLKEYFSLPEFSGVVDVDLIKENEAERKRAQRILNALSFFQKGTFVLMGIFFLAILVVLGVFISSSFVDRKKEIFIMRLVGASHNFIRMPFLGEAFFIAFLGSAFGFLLFWVFRFFTIPQILSVFETYDQRVEMAMSMNNIFTEFYSFLPEYFLMIVGMALIISFVTVEKFLRKRNILQSI